jgi:hypothetical protein
MNDKNSMAKILADGFHDSSRSLVPSTEKYLALYQKETWFHVKENYIGLKMFHLQPKG